MKNNYSEPKLLPKDRDINKPWFVAFRFTNPDNGDRKQFQFRGDINRHKTKHDRIIEGNSLCAALKTMLKEGWNPISDEIEKDYERKYLYDLLDEMLEIKNATIKRKSYRTYMDAKNILQTWMKKKHLRHIMPQAFTTKLAREFADYLLTKKKYAGKTFNSMMSFMKMYFNMLIAREVIEKNPFAKIDKVKHDIGKNHAYTAIEKKELIALLKSENQGLYQYVSFMYHSFIRRTELTLIKISDIDYHNRTIMVRSSVSKNRKQESVSIPQGLWAVITEMELQKYPSHYYIFAHGLKPGEKYYKKPDLITSMHHRYVKRLNYPPEKTLYSWKHTGVCDYYNEIKDPYVIMRQLRPSNLQITMTYLKSLGLTPNEKMHNANLSL